ncbi:Mfa1 family fimbria major subunit [Parabacteroides sp. PF5-6]|uniref:Mfa1 family fimbria major subunit n=1 Tax=Parabacteroides sp. PF5-6 TaxID=1742403 RepID=UPI002404FE80|nr:Mfa1 family fimbria major subunit [Parabacteroides sp. PF5-6]MDF9830794.1 hypothetical protein [Parabacteroides sp. PF5-6]
MKKINYNIVGYLFVALCILFNACTDNNQTIDPPVIAEEGEGFLSINLTTGQSAATKAPVEAIDPWEHRVNQVWILLYNEKNTLDYKYVLDVQNYTAGPSVKLEKFTNVSDEVIRTENAETLRFQSIAQSVKRQQYKMVVLANPPAAIFNSLNISKDSELSLLTTAITGLQASAINKFGGYEGDADAPLFFMSNANGLVTVPVTKLYPTKDEAHASPVQVNIDRLLAKVSVKEREGGVNITTKDVVLDKDRPLRWYTDVTNKSTYLIRQFAPLAGGTEMETEENSPKDRENVYARDPNFVLSENNANAFNTWNKNEEVPYATWISDKAADKKLRTFQYVMENTFDKETQKDADWTKFATRVVLKVHLIYKNLLLDPNDIENEDDPNRNYYSCLLDDGEGKTQWRVFTQEQAAHWLDRGFPAVEKKEEESAEEEAARIEEEKWLNLLEAKIKKIQGEYGTVAGAFNFANTQPPGTVETLYRSYDGVTYHPLGLNYYSIPIRHFGKAESGSDARENYGYYGVVRNNMYTVTINSITGPGNGIYDWENRFISTDISITKWYKRTQSVDLEYD